MGALRFARLALAAAAGYLAGTIPSADVAARLATRGQVDIRSEGTGNPGAANAMNVLGAKWGVAVMGADIAKGAAACRLGRRLAGDDLGAHVGGVSAVAGHCHPVWTSFRGGKGVATSVGQVVATFPVYAPFDVAVAAATHALPRWRNRAFAATTAASVAWVGGAAVWARNGWPNGWGPRPSRALPVAAALSSAIITNRFLAEDRRSAATASRSPISPVTGAT